MKKLKLSWKRSVWIMTAALGFGMLLFFTYEQPKQERSEEELATAEIVRTLQEQDIEGVQTVVKETQEALVLLREESGEDQLRKRFKRAVVLGDSITQGLVDYEILSAQNCVGTRGARIDTMMEDFDRIKEQMPKVIFLEYGMNDLEYVRGDAARFVEVYAQQIDHIKKELPKTKLVVNAILPVSQEAISKKPVYGTYASFNEALQQLCEEKGCVYVDNSKLLSQLTYAYEFDGIHPTPSYYELWATQMANVAGL